MALQLWALALLGLAGTSASLRPRKLDSFRSETELNHLVVDEASGMVYVGAVNMLYQLSADLQLEQRAATGPALDNKKCTPPIEVSQCHEAVQTDNVNQLLLLDPPRSRLVECGSLFKGICALRALGNISTRLFYEDGSGEKSFVASNDESVATVGLVSAADPGGERLLFVGKGNGPHDNGVIVSTRLLDRTEGREAFEAYTDHATYKAGYMSSNTQQFVAAFEDGPYVFFVFNQQDKHPARNRTLLARMCKQDPFYYSYLEVDLSCLDPGDAQAPAFGTCLAASLDRPGSGGVLYAVFSTDGRGGRGPRTGLCLFPLDEVHHRMEANRDACYTGAREVARDTFYKPFHGDIQCGGHVSVRGLSVLTGAWATCGGVCAWPCLTCVHMPPCCEGCVRLHGCVGFPRAGQRGHPHGCLFSQVLGAPGVGAWSSEHPGALVWPGWFWGMCAAECWGPSRERGLGQALTPWSAGCQQEFPVWLGALALPAGQPRRPLGQSRAAPWRPEPDGRDRDHRERPHHRLSGHLGWPGPQGEAQGWGRVAPGGVLSAQDGPALTARLPPCPQVYFAPDGSSTEYGAILVEINKRIKRDLVLAADLASLYAMTQDKVGPWGPGEGPSGVAGAGSPLGP